MSHEGLALYSLIKGSNLDALEHFLSKTKIDLNSPISSLQLLPIQIAFVLNSHNIIGLLIKYGADPNYESLDLISPMFRSDNVWSEDLFNALLDHGTTIRDLKFYGSMSNHPVVLSIDTRHSPEITARLIANTVMSLDDWMKLLYYTLQKARTIVSLVIGKIFSSMPFPSPLDKRVQGLKLLKTLFTMLHNVTVETTVIHDILSQFDFVFADTTLFTSFAAPRPSPDNPFTLLPNELVVSIFNQLAVPTLLRLSRTCKALHHYAHLVTCFDTSFRSLYSPLPRKHLVHTNYDLKKAAQLLFLINRFPHITSAFLGSILVFPYAAQQLLSKWWSNGMKSLTIRCLDRQKTLDLFNVALATSGRLLERLDLNCFQRGHDVFVDTVRALNHLPNLKFVSIVSRHYRPPPDSVEVSLTNAALMSLKLSGHHQYSSARITLTLDTPRLEYLSLINTTQRLILRHTAQLHTLKIVANDAHDVDFSALAHLTQLKLVVPLAKPYTNFPQLRKLGVTLSHLEAWAASAPHLNDVSLYFGNNPTLQNRSLSALLPNVHTVDVHNEDTIQLLPNMSVSTFKCTKFEFQSDTVVDKYPSSMEHFWIRSSNIIALPETFTDKDGSLLLPPTLQSLHIFKTSVMCSIVIKQVPYISLIANYGSDIVINVANVQRLELLDNSCKITVQGDFSQLRHLILRRNTSVKISDDKDTLNKQALLTFDSDLT